MSAKAPQVILYSTTLHTWEVWSQGRPLAHGALESCQEAYPAAMSPDQRQLDLAANDKEQS